MPACSAVPVVPAAAERHRPKKMAHGHKTPHRARQRATIVLPAARGAPMPGQPRRRKVAEVRTPACQVPAESGTPLDARNRTGAVRMAAEAGRLF